MREKSPGHRRFSLCAMLLLAAATMACAPHVSAADAQSDAPAAQLRMTDDQAGTALRLARAARQAAISTAR